MNNYKICFLLLLTTLNFKLNAQQLPLFNGKLLNEYVNNPACAGEKDIARASAFFRTQYDNMPNPPLGFAVMSDGKFKGQKHGFGAQFIGQRTTTNSLYNGMLTYSYELIPDQETHQKLTFGLSVGAYYQQTDFTRIKVNDIADPRLLDGQVSNIAANLNFGILYRLGRFRVGIAGNNLLGLGSYLRNEYSDTFSVYQSARHYFGSISYLIKLKKGSLDYILEPYLAVNAVSGLTSKTDLMMTFRYLQKYNIGIGYRANGTIDFESSSLVAYTSLKLFEKVELGYFFEMMYGGDYRASLGNSHELQLNYYLPYRR